MSRKLDQLESELLSLEPHVRATLARTLLESLDNLSEEECERLWVDEADARYRDFKAGKSIAIDGDEVFSRARARKR